MAGYTAKLKSGKEIYIPTWSATLALENLTQCGQFIGVDATITISELNIPAAMIAIMNSKDPENTSGLIKSFVVDVRIDEERISKSTYDSMFEDNLFEVVEIFAHVVKAQYADFFALGLAKEASPET